LVNIIFEGNHGVYAGGIYCSGSSPTLIGCTFWNNTAEIQGGAMRCTRASPVVISCTFVGNHAPQASGGIFCDDNASLIIENTIIAFNGDAEAVFCAGASQVTSTCCDVYGNGVDWDGCLEGQWGVDGNIWEDPMFCDYPNGDFGLLEGSPCAPFSEPNTECDLIGAWPVGCQASEAPWPPDAGASIALRPAVPNPSGSVTRLTYVVPRSPTAHPVELSIYDAAGRLVRRLVHGTQPAGLHESTWDGKNESGLAVGNGVYFQRFRWNGTVLSRPITLLR
jgi:hypothetical protein